MSRNHSATTREANWAEQRGRTLAVCAKIYLWMCGKDFLPIHISTELAKWVDYSSRESLRGRMSQLAIAKSPRHIRRKVHSIGKHRRQRSPDEQWYEWLPEFHEYMRLYIDRTVHEFYSRLTTLERQMLAGLDEVSSKIIDGEREWVRVAVQNVLVGTEKERIDFIDMCVEYGVLSCVGGNTNGALLRVWQLNVLLYTPLKKLHGIMANEDLMVSELAGINSELARIGPRKLTASSTKGAKPSHTRQLQKERDDLMQRLRESRLTRARHIIEAFAPQFDMTYPDLIRGLYESLG